MEFKNCKLTMNLIAQSPMVHFQWDEAGATLRGSELKPKLDKFLVQKAAKSNQKLPDGAYIDREKNAFNYKVTIEEIGEKAYSALCDMEKNKNAFAFVFGDRDKFLVLGNAKLTILCMNRELQKLIQNNIEEFFAITNFGFRQDKGFGSFMPEEFLDRYKNDQKTMIRVIANWVRDDCQAETCYYMDFHNRLANDKSQDKIYPYRKIFEQMKDFYDLLKTGRNLANRGEYSRAFIYQYMHKIEIGNEKAWMKKEGIAPVLETTKKASGESKNANPRYVRALLGVGSHVEYLNHEHDRREKVHVTIKNDTIERMESTILFKMIDGYVFICANRIPDEIYGKKFTFESMIKRNRKNLQQVGELKLKEGTTGTIVVPTKEELEKAGFSIDDLLAKFVSYYNNDAPNEEGKLIEEAVPSVTGNTKVKVVGGDKR